MGFLDKLSKKVDRRTLEKAAGQAREKLGDVVDKHGDKIADGIDKAAAAADKRTGGKHHDERGQQPSDKPAGTVVQEHQKGYVLHGRLLRPARVVISAGPAPQGDGANA